MTNSPHWSAIETLDDFVQENRGILLGYFLLEKHFPNRHLLEGPYPPSELDEAELETFKNKFVECIPLHSIFVGLWDWDIHFEEDLGDDWFFEVAFGKSSSLNSCALELEEFFLERVDRFDLDYDQFNDPEAFHEMVAAEAVKFVADWRQAILAAYG
jgi:hypothetical protein